MDMEARELPNPARSLHPGQPEETAPHFVIADTFSCVYWRFEMNELDELRNFILSDDGPVNPRVWLISGIMELSDFLVSEKMSPGSKEKPDSRSKYCSCVTCVWPHVHK